MNWADHLIVAPIIVPLMAGGLMLLLDGRTRFITVALALASVGALLFIAIDLAMASAGGETAVRVYQIGGWPARFGIVLVVDRLAALMLLLTAILGAAALLFSLARWHRAGSYFHPMFQFQLMGLNGAFLTGDLFNLFVFFEVLLAASYGLALHGSGYARVKASLHYIAVNLLAASVFLIGVSLIYGTAGTLNMADLALRIAELGPRDRALFEIGAGILVVAFLVKTAMWPIGFWLTGTYSASGAPVAALFSVMTKVGIYAILRLGHLMTLPGADESILFQNGWMLAGGVATVGFATIGMLASQDLPKLASFSVLVSSGTLLTVIGVGDAAIVGGALFYLASSTLAIGAFFLLVELVERGRAPIDDVLAVTLEAYGVEDDDKPDDESEGGGVAVPATLAVLGVAFMACAALLAGMPPLSGFIAKFAILTVAFDGGHPTGDGPVSAQVWILMAVLLVSGFTTLIMMVRAGIRSFWASIEREVPRVRVIEALPVATLIGLCVVLTVEAGSAMRFMQAAADGLRSPAGYIGAVLPEARAVPVAPAAAAGEAAP